MADSGLEASKLFPSTEKQPQFMSMPRTISDDNAATKTTVSTEAKTSASEYQYLSSRANSNFLTVRSS